MSVGSPLIQRPLYLNYENFDNTDIFFTFLSTEWTVVNTLSASKTVRVKNTSECFDGEIADKIQCLIKHTIKLS